MDPPSLSSREATKSTSASPRKEKETHVVKVGAREDPHQFSPAEIVAAPGDVISFEFYPRNHSVVKADYKAPCVPSNKGLFYSGAFDKFNEVDGHLQGGVCFPLASWVGFQQKGAYVDDCSLRHGN